MTTSCLCVELPYLWQKGWTEAGDFCGFGYSRGRSASLLLRRPYLVTPPDGMRGLGLGRRGVCACYDRYAAEKPTVDG